MSCVFTHEQLTDGINGTGQTLVWMQRTQQSFSYPAFFHLAMRLRGATSIRTTLVATQRHNSLGVCVPLFQEPVIELLADRLALVVQLVDVPGASVRNAHYGPKGLALALALMILVLRISHLLSIVFEDLVV